MHEPDPRESLAGVLDRPLHPTRRFVGQLRVVKGVPGLYEATRTSGQLAARISSIMPSMAARPSAP